MHIRVISLVCGLAILAGTQPVSAQDRAADAKPRPKADSGAVPTAIGGSGGLVVSGIDVDVGGKNPSEARMNGWRQAQREGWKALWNRMSGLPANSAPNLADSALDGIVSAIEIEREQIGPDRYVGRLAVIFDRVRASSYLGRFAALSSSPPFLLLPVLQDAATRQAHEADSPWLAAWARLRAGESPIDYVRIRPTPGDTILLNAWQAERRHLFLWRALIDRYQVADVLIPELILDRSFDGGPLTGLLIVRFGPTGREVGRVRLTNRAGDVNGLMDTAVREADTLYIAALRSGNLLPDPSLIEPEAPVEETDDSDEETGGWEAAGGVQVGVLTPDDQTLQSIQRTVAGTPGVAGVTLRAISLGGESTLEIAASVPMDELRYNLDQRGLRLEGGKLRRRAAGEAPLPPPGAPAGEVPLQEGAPTEAVSGGD